MSIVLRPPFPAALSVRITTAAAVAVCRAAQSVFGVGCGIKWVNDVFRGDRKICGILTEASLGMENGLFDYAVLGIGVNVYAPQGGFPAELSDIAGALSAARIPDGRARLMAAILTEFSALYADIPSGGYMEEYRGRCFVPGRQVTVLFADGTSRPASALGIDEECRLLVRYEDGTQAALSSGEISLRI